MDYFFVAQGKTTIPGVDDAEELELTDVRFSQLLQLSDEFAFDVSVSPDLFELQFVI